MNGMAGGRWEVGVTLRDHLSAEINTGRAQQHGLGFMGGLD